MQKLIILLIMLSITSAGFAQIRQGAYTPPPNTNTLVAGSVFNVSKQIYRPGDISTFDNLESVIGTKFMFDSFTDAEMFKDTTKIEGKFLFNYDKTTQVLVYTQDNENYFVPIDEKLTSISIHDVNNNIIFEKVPLISKQYYVIRLSKNVDGFSLYKSLKTKFKKAKKNSNGLVENSDNFNEYIDEYTYYILYPNNKRIITLANNFGKVKKELSTFNNNTVEVFNQNVRQELNDNFYINLLYSMNK